jgi:flagellar hook-associated protein 1
VGAWSDLATSPNNGAARAVVQQRGAQVADLFNSYDAGLTAQRNSSIDRMSATVSEINMLASQVAELNGRLVAFETGGAPANDLRDQRDMALDRLSKLAGTRVLMQNDGSATVLIGNSNLVNGNNARPLHLELAPPVPAPAVTPSDIPVRVRLGDSPDPLSLLGGELDGIARTINTDIPALRGRLDAMASSLVTAVNAAHTAGYTFSGNSIPGTAAGNFFDAGTVTNPVRGSTIRLDAVIAADSSKIAASDDASAPTGNGTATALAALRIDSDTVSYTENNGVSETGSFLGFFRATVTRLGIDVRRASDDTTIYTTLAEQAEGRRQSVSGVNTDEELVQMLKVQQSYVAATKLIKAADDMLQTLLALI